VEVNPATANEHGFTFAVLLQKWWEFSMLYGISARLSVSS